MNRTKDGLEIPKEFIDRFQGEIYPSRLIKQVFSGWNEAYVQFISTQSRIIENLTIYPEFGEITAEVLAEPSLKGLKQAADEMITLDEAMEIVNNPVSLYEKSETYSN